MDIKQVVFSALAKTEKLPYTREVVEELHTEMFGWTDVNWMDLAKFFHKGPPGSQVLARKEMEILVAKGDLVNCDTFIVMPSASYPTLIQNLTRFVEVARHSKGLGQICFCLLFDGKNRLPNERLSVIMQTISALNATYIVGYVKKPLGYARVVQLAVEKFAYSKVKYVGFIDDDAYIYRDDHYDVLASMFQNSELVAASGLAVDKNTLELKHDFFNVASSFEFAVYGQAVGYDLSKPHIHGGGGACLMRRDYFTKYIDFVVRNGLLIGPTVSALATKEGKLAVATHQSLVIHPTKNSFHQWLVMVKRYYNSWNFLVSSSVYKQTTYNAEHKPKLYSALHDFSEESFNLFQALSVLRGSFKHAYTSVTE